MRSQEVWRRVPLLQKIATCAEKLGIEVRPHYIFYSPTRIHLSKQTIVLNEKLCRISHCRFVDTGRGIRRAAQVKKPAPAVLAQHDFWVIWVDVEINGQAFEEIYCLPKRIILKLPTSKRRHAYIPLDAKLNAGGPNALLDWTQYVGLGSIKGELLAESLTKEEWLDQPVVALGPGVLSDAVLSEIANMMEAASGVRTSFTKVTVRELLALSVDTGPRLVTLDPQKLNGLQTRLREVGFSYEDGAFLHIGTRRHLVEKVMEICALERPQAEMVVDSANRVGWSDASWKREE